MAEAPTWMLEAIARRGKGEGLPTDKYAFDPGLILAEAGLDPYPWQQQVLRCIDQQLALACSRQVGKTYTVGALAIKTALLQKGAMVLLLAPTQRQSGELFRDKVLKMYRRLGKPVKLVRETATEVELENGSRIVALPENEVGIVGFSSVNLLVIDEAARVSDGLYYSVRPMLAASKGRLVLLSSPYGKRGFFHEEWEGGTGWRRWKVRADECPHYSAEFLAQEKRSMGERWYAQEYEVAFNDVIDAVFSQQDIDAAMAGQAKPLFGGGEG